MHEVSKALPMEAGMWALFLDVDGTLIDIAETPDSVDVPPELPRQVAALSQSLDGALAMVSGRSIAAIDALFDPFRFAAAGLHGMEIRSSPDGPVERVAVNGDDLGAARRKLDDLAQAWPGMIVEDKDIGFAVHYRKAPDAANDVDRLVDALLAQMGREWMRQDGKMVVEIRPSGTNKGDAVARLMATARFRGRFPITIGDDLTDEMMFAYANDALGRSIRVGTGAHSSLAQFTVESPRSIREWIARLAHSATV